MEHFGRGMDVRIFKDKNRDPRARFFIGSALETPDDSPGNVIEDFYSRTETIQATTRAL